MSCKMAWSLVCELVFRLICTNKYIPVRLTLSVHYPDAYPNALPKLSLKAIEGDLEEEESGQLIEELNVVVCSFKVHFQAF